MKASVHRRVAVLAALSFGLALLVVMPALASPSSEAAQLEKQLAEIRARAKEAGRAYDQAHWRLDETEVRISDTDARIEAGETELAAARGLLGDRIEQMYRADATDYLSVLLGAGSYQEMITRIEFVQRIGSADAEAIRGVEEVQARLRADREALVLEGQEREAALGELARSRDALQRELTAKQNEYDKAKARLDEIRRQQQVAASSAHAAAVTPKSNGMVFPVRGVYYYSDTWGASRSGGRRTHKGTDIMAARGTPCVAVLSGSVTAKTSSLGGKTIWLTADNGWKFYYAHLDSWAVSSGRVSAGQVIGYVGSTGNASASAPHLHFEIHPNGGAAVNPYPYLKAME